MHEGHRERLRNKLLSSPSSLEPHEVLEVLLFYAIPRKNTNEKKETNKERELGDE